MLSSSLVLLHISGASVALLSGFLAMSLRKGSNWHGAAGTLFFVSMLSMASSGVLLAGFLRPNRANLVVSLLTLYLVTTAWRAARNREGGIVLFDRAALIYILCVSATGLAGGIEAANSPRGVKDHMPAAVYFVFGTIALLCAVTDFRMIRRGGVIGSQRIVRHLWRMSLALLIAALSFYPGQAKLFPRWIRDTNLLLVPAVLVFGAMLFYRVRTSRSRSRQERVVPGDLAQPMGEIRQVTGVA